MYTINYVSGIIKKNKFQTVYLRFFKILNLFVHLLILTLLLFSVFFYVKIQEYNENIISMKSSIEEKRQINKIVVFEKEWNEYYFKLLAIREQLAAKTNYSLAIKDLGTYLPEDYYITTLTLLGDNMEIILNLKKDKLKELTNFRDYENILKMAFDKSMYLGRNISIESSYEEKIGDSVLNLMKITMPVMRK